MEARRAARWSRIIGSTAGRRQFGFRAALLLIALMSALQGCQPRTQEQARSEATPSGSETSMAGKQVINLRVTPAGCVDYSPPRTTISLGDSIVWNSSADTVIVVHLPAGAFGDSSWAVPKQGQVSTGPGLRAGSYALTAQPATCSASTGDTGPAVIISEGKP